MNSNIMIGSTEIHYLDNLVDSDQTILFIHGNSHSSRTFRNQFKDQELQHYRLIAIDLPGHGISNQLSEYNLPQFVQVLKDFCEALNLSSLILVGHSLGGHIALEALSVLNPRGIFIFGTPPLSIPLSLDGFKANEHLQLVFKDDLSDLEVEKLISTFYERKEIHPIDIEDVKRTDKKFRSLMFQSFSLGLFQDELKILNGFQGPKAVVCGTMDKLINSTYLQENIDLGKLWQQKVIEIESSHNLHIESYHEFNQELFQFANFVFSTKISEVSTIGINNIII